MSNDLSSVLKVCRGDKTLREVEEKTGISNAYLSQLERGIATQPSPAILYKLANLYDYPYEDLMRLAGYIKNEDSKKPKKIDPLREAQVALMSYGLNEDEVKQVTSYVEFVRNKTTS